MHGAFSLIRTVSRRLGAGAPSLHCEASDSPKKPEGAIMYETIGAWAPRALSVLRVITGLMIIEHGMGKLIHFPALPAYANVSLCPF